MVEDYDVVVVGSGAGGMVAALRAHDLGLRVLMVEKATQYGGTSATSGGGIWIPCNDQMASLGIPDSPEEAFAYLAASVKGRVPEERLRAYLAAAPEMLRYLEGHTHVRYQALPKYPDYYPDLSGWKKGARTMEPAPIDASKLGKSLFELREPAPTTLIMGRMSMSQAEGGTLFARAPGWKALTAKIVLRYWLDLPWRLRSRRDRRLTLGNALIAALRRSLQDRGVPLWLDAPLKSLTVHAGRVTGVVISRGSQEVRVNAACGVVLAAGGFERNQALREKYLPQPTRAEWSATPPTNTGDALQAGLAVGAATDLMECAWWVPSVPNPGHDRQAGLFAERAAPGVIIVNRNGQRFANEALPYLEFVDAMYRDHAKTDGSVPAWAVFDANFRRRYAFGPLLPSGLVPEKSLPAEWLGQVYFRADSLEALAAQLGIDTAGLATTVECMNRFAQTGVDEAFRKGDNTYDRYYGDPSVTPNPCLGPVVKPPFYAVRVDAGDTGTKGGLLTDAHARVLDEAGTPIDGLYAIGNCSASVMGQAYPGPGSTLGPAMTFGFLAADHIAQSSGDPPGV